MFTVTAIRIGVCIACEKQTECFEVESKKLGVCGLLCMQDFRKQVKVAMSIPDQLATPQTSIQS